MKHKLLLSLIIIFQISGCEVYDEQLNDSIEVHSQGIENRVATLENEINILQQELKQLTLKNDQLEILIENEVTEKSKENLKLNNLEDAKENFESSFELIRKGEYISAEIAFSNVDIHAFS